MANDQEGKTAIGALLSTLELSEIGPDIFQGESPTTGWKRVFGGQVLGQALVAAQRTVAAPRQVHSLHGYFILPGDPATPLRFEVQRTRDGGSFTTRLVNVQQEGRSIFTMSASFQGPEADAYDHQSAMPDVPLPEELPSADQEMVALLTSLPDSKKCFWIANRPIEVRPVDMKRYYTRKSSRAGQYIWMRTLEPLPDDPTVHEAVLAWASDFTLLDTALMEHGKLVFDRDIQIASLDHALWFHRPFRFDDWMLYAQDSPSASGSRALCRGSFYTREGRLVASAAQEGLFRKVTPKS